MVAIGGGLKRKRREEHHRAHDFDVARTIRPLHAVKRDGWGTWEFVGLVCLKVPQSVCCQYKETILQCKTWVKLKRQDGKSGALYGLKNCAPRLLIHPDFLLCPPFRRLTRVMDMSFQAGGPFFGIL